MGSTNVSGLYRHLMEVIAKTWNFAQLLRTDREHHSNAILGLVGEAGEVADIYKKMWFHTPRPEQRDELRLELGDVLYYWLKLVELNGFTIEEVIQGNRDKLSARYPKFFAANQEASYFDGPIATMIKERAKEHPDLGVVIDEMERVSAE